MVVTVVGHSQSFVASTNAKEVVENGTFQVTYKVENSNVTDFSPPTFHPFIVVAGPSQSSSTSIINGRRSTSFSISYTLMAQKKGNFTIPSAYITVGNRKVSSNSLKIKVVEGNASTNTEAFIKVELDTDSVYIGQQVVMSLKLYSTVTVQRYDVLYQPEFKDIYVKELPRFGRDAKLEVVDGVQYQTQLLKRSSLYPQKSGTFSFDGITARLGIPTSSGRRSGFFFNTQLTTRDVTSNEFAFTVMPLPEPQPASFSGGVGQYAAKVEIDKTRLSTDDALSLQMTIQGDGDQRLLLPPPLDLGEDFETYDANLINSNERPGEDRNRFVKSFEYLIIPKRAGQLVLKPEFTYYSPEENRYVTIQPDSFRLDVRQGTSESKALDRFNANQEIVVQPILHDWENPSFTSVFITSWWYWLGWLISVSGFLGLLVFRQRQLKILGADPTILKFNRANQIAAQRLEKARVLMKEPQNSRLFFEEVALATKAYLGDKLGVDPARFSRQTIGSELDAIQVNDDLKADVIQLLNDCDLAIFASSYAPNPQEVYDRALRTVTELEQILGKKSI